MAITVSICVATFRRPERLLLLLEDLARQTAAVTQVVVVDNDATGSARPSVEAMLQRQPPYELVYEIQPERNIALTRNRTVARAHGDWLAFIDDDERAPPEWLEQLMSAAHEWKADVVLAPVVCQLPDDAPAWIKAGPFYVRIPRLASGSEVPPNRLIFGNALLRGSLVRAEPGPFNVAYGLASGEDGDMLLRLARRGGRIIWCDEAIVNEPVEPSRLSLRYLMKRSYSGGQAFAHSMLGGRYGAMSPAGRVSFLLNCIAKLGIAALLVPPTLVMGRHHSAGWLIRAAANVGKLSAFTGAKYHFYKTASASPGQKENVPGGA